MCGGGVQDGAASGWARPTVSLVAITILSAALLGASYLKSDWTNNDFERFADLRLTFLYFAVLGAACAAYVALFFNAPAVPTLTVAVGTAFAGVLLLASFPVGSKDVFLYAFFGKVWGTYGANPYVVPPSTFSADAWQPFAQMRWAEQPALYGPLFLWQARLIDAVAAGRLFVAVWAYKVVAATACATAIVLGARLIRAAERQPATALALLAWNPLLLFEGMGNGHNDAVMVLFLLEAIWLHMQGGRRRTVAAPAVLALAVWYKWYALLCVPAFLIAVHRDGASRSVRQWLIAALLIGGGVGVFLLAPLASAIPLVAHRLVTHEVVRQVFPLQISPLLTALLSLLEMVGLTNQRWGLLWFDAARMALFAGVASVVLAAQWRHRLNLVSACCLLSSASALLVVTVLWPWHLEVPIALALVAGGPRWGAFGLVLTLLGILSYFFTFLWAAVLLVAVSSAVWIIRRLGRAYA